MMLYGFLLIVIKLNKKRRDAGEPVDDSFLFKSPEEFIHSIVSSHLMNHNLTERGLCEPNTRLPCSIMQKNVMLY